ncbi:hypothetical protein BDY21DRAFT_361968 [Lineolata rhizophorae]|uniref:Uncharacterized protein n=1 Tax=Lineolata rhizophorae TaxID=578093 RepID=A0A6A6P8D5_9PEZI|nr:hypothetical protein BDY21DRAFT_361968 [Lineolata rhizophorae]
MMNRLFLLSILSSFLAGSALAEWDASQRDCPGDVPCLTSFLWCEKGPPGDDGRSEDCSYPDGVDPAKEMPFAYQIPAALVWDYPEGYNLTWNGTDPDYPVMLRWTMTVPDSVLLHELVVWEINITTPSPFSFQFRPSPSWFSPQNTPNNYSSLEIRAVANLGQNYLSISQPENPATNSSDVENTDDFIMFSQDDRQYAYRLRDDARDSGNWDVKITAGLSVSLTAVVFSALAVLATRWYERKKFTKRLADEKAQAMETREPAARGPTQQQA